MAKKFDFYNKKLSKLDSNHIFLAVISLDSTLKKDDNYHPQGFSKKNVNTFREKQLVSMIT